jgi:hypothetical protein
VLALNGLDHCELDVFGHVVAMEDLENGLGQLIRVTLVVDDCKVPRDKASRDQERGAVLVQGCSLAFTAPSWVFGFRRLASWSSSPSRIS